jgi:hypothetical protein
VKERDSKDERVELSLKRRRGPEVKGYRKVMYSQGTGRQIEVIKKMRIMGSQSRGVRK